MGHANAVRVRGSSSFAPPFVTGLTNGLGFFGSALLRCGAGLPALRSARPTTSGLNASATGLPNDSVAVPLGLELVDRSWLTERVGQLPAALVDAIDDGIRAVLNL